MTSDVSDNLKLTNSTNTVSINDLPNEVLEHIISLLPPYKDLENCTLVCKRWQRNVQNVIKHKKIDFCRAIRNFKTEWENTSQSVQSHIITKRYSHSACVHENSMYVFGGCTSTSTTFNDLWKLDLSTRKWQRLLTMGRYPSPKAYASLVYYKRNLVLFGGWTHPSPYPLHQAWRTFNELHVYNIDENYWNRMNNASLYPPSMAGHSATVHRDSMVIFGGLQDYKGGSNDVWCLNLNSYTWIKKETNEVKPHPRYGHSQIAINDDYLLILGGWGGPPNMVMNDDVWLLNMTGRIWIWSLITVRNHQWAASHLWCHPACKVDDYVVVLSKNPDSSLTSLAYSRWTTNSHIGVNQRRQVPLFPGANPFRISGENAGPSVDRDVNVNGRRGSFTRHQATAAAPVELAAVPAEQSMDHPVPGLNPAPANNMNMVAFRNDRFRRKFREKRLAVLRRMEQRLRILETEEEAQQQAAQKKQLRKNQPPKMAMFVLDISSVLEDGSAEWVPIKSVACGGPETTILYSLVIGNGELIMFGGIKKESGFTMNERDDSENPSDSVSNSLHFITAPQSSI